MVVPETAKVQFTVTLAVRFPTGFSANQIITVAVAGGTALIPLVVFLVLHWRYPDADNVRLRL